MFPEIFSGVDLGQNLKERKRRYGFIGNAKPKLIDITVPWTLWCSSFEKVATCQDLNFSIKSLIEFYVKIGETTMSYLDKGKGVKR